MHVYTVSERKRWGNERTLAQGQVWRNGSLCSTHNTANVTGHRPIAVLAVIVEAPAVLPEQGAALDSAAAAVD